MTWPSTGSGLVHGVKDLESAQEEMNEEEKKEYHRLQF